MMQLDSFSGYKSLMNHISKPITCINFSKSGCRSLQSSCMQNFIKIGDRPFMDLLLYCHDWNYSNSNIGNYKYFILLHIIYYYNVYNNSTSN